MLVWQKPDALSIDAGETCTGCCSLLDPWRLNPLGEDVVHAAVLQDEGWQGVHPCQLLQCHLICGVMYPGRAPALASLLLYTRPSTLYTTTKSAACQAVGNQMLHLGSRRAGLMASTDQHHAQI